MFFFLFIFSQVPLHVIGKLFLKDCPNHGNVLVWVSIILGQPLALAILLYFYDFYVFNSQVCILICSLAKQVTTCVPGHNKHYYMKVLPSNFYLNGL